MFADEISGLALYGSCRVILSAVSVELTLNGAAFALRFAGLGSSDASHSVPDLLLARTAGAAKLGIPRASQHPATLAVCRLRSETKRHTGSVLGRIRELV